MKFIFTIFDKDNKVQSKKTYKNAIRTNRFVKNFFNTPANHDCTLFLFICEEKNLITRFYKFDKNQNKITFQTVLYDERLN